MFVRLSRIVAVLLVLAGSAGAGNMDNKPQKPPREVLEVTRATYAIIHGEQKKGTEEIVRTVYNDNTVEFDVAYSLTPTEGVTTSHEVALVVREDTYYPVRYEQDKHIKQQDMDVELTIDLEMFANVAAVTSGSPGQTGTRHVVLPTGTAMVETGVVYVYYPLLFYYDQDLGGRQNVDVLDVTAARQSTAVLQRIGRDAITVDGKDYEADLYQVERDKFSVKLFVGDDGRILRVDQNFMQFDLTEWSREGDASGAE